MGVVKDMFGEGFNKATELLKSLGKNIKNIDAGEFMGKLTDAANDIKKAAEKAIEETGTKK